MTDKDSETTAIGARDEYRYAKLALAWHGWGSPVGLGLFLLCLAIAGVLARAAIVGF